MSGTAQTDRVADALEEANRGRKWPTRISTLALLVSFSVPALQYFFALPGLEGRVNDIVSDRLVDNVWDDPYPQELVELAEVSSYRQDRSGSLHPATNLIDDDPTTAWSECKGGAIVNRGDPRRRNCPAGDLGEGEYVEFRLEREIALKAVRIRNGFGRDDQIFVRNPRVQELTITVRQAQQVTHEETVRLQDIRAYQNIRLGRAPRATSVRLTIKSAYGGEEVAGKEAFYDTSLSEIRFIPEKAVRSPISPE